MIFKAFRKLINGAKSKGEWIYVLYFVFLREIYVVFIMPNMDKLLIRIGPETWKLEPHLCVTASLSKGSRSV